MSALDDIPLWKAVFLGNKLPSVYRPHLRVIGAFKLVAGLRWKPSTDSMQLDLTSFCNLKCANCERSIGQAPCKDYISLEQMEKFVDESMVSGTAWRAVHLIGGEPTLHPQFFDALDILKRYKDLNTACYVVIWTNGYGKKVNDVLSQLPPWTRIENSKKDPTVVPKFVSYNVAPIDLKKYENADFTKGCYVTEHCGITLTKYGYYPCGPGATVDRVFGFDVGIKRLQDVTDDALTEQLDLLCRYCGYFKTSELFAATKLVTEQTTSASWEKAYDNYKNNRPALSFY